MEHLLMAGFALVGVSAVTYGVAQYSGPAGWITVGGACLGVAVWPLIRERWWS